MFYSTWFVNPGPFKFGSKDENLKGPGLPNQVEENIPKKVCKEKYRKIKQKVKSVRQKS